MFDSRKLILSPFTGHGKRKAWNKSREKCMPVKRRQNFAETDRGFITTKKMSRRIFRG